jgi:hypothetical protein
MHILNNRHEYGPITNTMTLLRNEQKRQPDYWRKNSYSPSPTINKIYSYRNKPQTLYIIPYSNS